jgi:putative transposase
MNAPTEPQAERTRYATDLTDQEWAHLEPLVPSPKKGGRPAKYERREILNAILYLLRTGCSWRLLPHDFPSWRIVYWYFSIWRNEGLFEGINDALRREVRIQAGRNPEPSGTVIDSQSVKSTEKGGHQATKGMTPPRR